MMRALRNIMAGVVHRFGRWYNRLVLRSEYEHQGRRQINERPIEYGFLMQAVRDVSPCDVLDVGTGMTALPALLRTCGCTVTASDNIKDYWPKGMLNRYFHIVNDDVTKPALSAKFDMVTCISVLEHIEDFDAAIAGMVSLLKHPGFIVLTFPYNEKKFVDNVYKLEGSTYGQDAAYKCHVFSRKNIEAWCEKHSLEIVRQEHWKAFTGELWTFGQRLHPPVAVGADDEHQLTCLLLKQA